jgi:hypothetical protein
MRALNDSARKISSTMHNKIDTDTLNHESHPPCPTTCPVSRLLADIKPHKDRAATQAAQTRRRATI